jgi:hypothetical protein
MNRILLMILGLSVFLCADFTRDANGIVTDNTSALQWQDNAIGSIMGWEEAIAYCEGLDLDGTGWRLPNINELKMLIDDSKKNPAIVDGFTQTSSGNYWSSTTSEGDKGHAWPVDFYAGRVSHYSKGDYSFYVRCVRDGQ